MAFKSWAGLLLLVAFSAVPCSLALTNPDQRKLQYKCIRWKIAKRTPLLEIFYDETVDGPGEKQNIFIHFLYILFSSLFTVDKLVAFRDAMLARPVNDGWKKGLASWTCPTEASNSVGSSCDPCGQQSWGNWDHVGCRGAPVSFDKYGTPGSGVVTNIHVTDYGIEGPIPLPELCGFKSLREFDVDGGRLTGNIPTGFADCFPDLREIDLSYNQVSGEIPAEIAAVEPLRQFKVEVNSVTGSIPEAFGSMAKVIWLRFAKNKMSGSIPQSLANTAAHLHQLTLDNNNFQGNLYMLSKHQMVSFSAHENPKLCGMVPLGVRFGHGFNFHNTGLGMPCADELANGIETD